MSYSSKLIPYKGLQKEANVNMLLDVSDFSLARRCDGDVSNLEKFGNSYVIPYESAILDSFYKRIPSMSMTYVDCVDSLKSASYKIDKKVRDWNGENINFVEYAQSVEFVTPSFQLVYSAKNLQNIKIPYSRKFESEKDMVKYGLSELFSEGPFSRETPYPMNGKINLKHSPTDLNYRHFELKIHDDKGKTVENFRSFQSSQMKPQRNGIDELAQYIFEHILRKNFEVDKLFPGTSSLPEDVFFDENIPPEEREQHKKEMLESYNSADIEVKKDLCD